MSTIETETLTIEQIYALAFNVLSKYGCNEENANAISTTVSSAERDGSLSHGLFRVPGYVASLKSGKVNGKAEPKISSSRIVVSPCHGASLMLIARCGRETLRA